MRKVLLILIPVILIIGAAAFILSGGKSPLTQTKTVYKGVSLSPKSFQGQEFANFFEEARTVGNALTWAGDWDELSRAAGSPAVVATEAPKKGLTPIIIVTAFSEKNRVRSPIRALTKEVTDKYVSSAADFAKKYNLKYLGVGIEINRINKTSTSSFDAFVTLFNDTYQAVKASSPNTKVFTIWQLENMKGLYGGLFGGKNDTTRDEWSLLSKLDKADLFAYTTYPGIIYKDPNEIPSDHYTNIKNRTSKGIAFVEVGWMSSASIKGYESSEEEQSRFVTKFGELTKSLGSEINIWAFLYDQNIAEPFTSMGLIDKNGSARQALQVWKTLSF